MSTKTVEYWEKRLAQLQKIKNPNDYTKHQIRSAKSRIDEFRVKSNEALHSSKKPSPKRNRRGRILKIQPKVDRSVKLDRNYKEEEAKAFEAAKKFKNNNNKNNKTEPKNNNKTSGVGPVKSGDEYAKKLKGTTKGVGPVKDGDTYAKGIEKSESLKIKKSNVFTKHYKTGKQLGVMTRNERRAYDKAAAAHIRDKNKNKNKGK
tara:strand:+ start:54 stop:665 length:612 start_codon:yes stop_codon:yes gene_type:complete